MCRPTDVKPLPGYKLHIRYSDGVEGDADLSALAGKGVFALWNDPGALKTYRSANVARFGGATTWIIAPIRCT